jgi:hypothetical protein
MVLNRSAALGLCPTHPATVQARLREGLAWLFLASILALILLGGWLAFRFTLPAQPAWISIGTVERFTPRADPYFFSNTEISLYLYNDGEKIFAILPQTNFIRPCMVAWETHRQRFVDPCYGAHYSPYGDYAFVGPPPERGLDRLPVQISASGEIQIQRDAVSVGRTPTEVQSLCHKHTPSQRFIPSNTTIDLSFYAGECDFRAIARRAAGGN